MRSAILGVLLSVLASAGCGESAQAKRDRALSQVEVLAERLSAQVGEDGWFKRHATDAPDPWGNPVEVKYTRLNGYERLAVWSSGPDGLPHTRDDIASHTYTCYNDVALAEIAAAKAKGRQASIEGYGASLTKGLVKGTVQGWKDRNKE